MVNYEVEQQRQNDKTGKRSDWNAKETVVAEVGRDWQKGLECKGRFRVTIQTAARRRFDNDDRQGTEGQDRQVGGRSHARPAGPIT